MKKGCLARFLAIVFFIATIYLGCRDYTLNQYNNKLKTDLAVANQRLADAQAQQVPASSPAQAPAPSDWLTQAQMHADKAGEALCQLDFNTARQEWKAATKALEGPPAHMTAQMRKRYDLLKKQLAAIRKQANALFGA